MSATRSSWLHAFFAFRKSFAIFSTLLGTNWWNLGMAGKLPEFLCPRECVGTLDYVGLDYYWGVPSFWPGELHRLSAASDFQYANAPVWPRRAQHDSAAKRRGSFPASRSSSIENGCVGRASGIGRADYLKAHVNQVRKASREARRSKHTSAGASPRIASGACPSTMAAISGSTTSISTPIPHCSARLPTRAARMHS